MKTFVFASVMLFFQSAMAQLLVPTFSPTPAPIVPNTTAPTAVPNVVSPAMPRKTVVRKSYVPYPAYNYNVRANVLPALLGTVSMDVTRKISHRWSVGLTANGGMWDGNPLRYIFYGGGVIGNYFFQGSIYRNSFYVSPSFIYESILIHDKSSSNSETLSGMAGGVVVGYQWYLANGINLSLGVGARYTMVGSEVEIEDNHGVERKIKVNAAGLTPVFDLAALGFAF